MTILIDSDILIELTRAKDSAILGKWKELSESENILLCSPVSVAELWHGAVPREFEATTNLFRFLTCVPIDAATGRQAGDYLRQYFKSHGVKLVVDPKSIMLLEGTEIDFVEGLMGSGFKFNNPNVRHSCACGESFTA